MSIQVHIGQAVRQRRAESGLTQEDLGFEANLDRTYISLIERGEANITVEKLAQLASALNVPCFELIKPL